MGTMATAARSHTGWQLHSQSSALYSPAGLQQVPRRDDVSVQGEVGAEDERQVDKTEPRRRRRAMEETEKKCQRSTEVSRG